jgi:serine/threonine-protein kinase Chk2
MPSFQASLDNQAQDLKKPRRSDRISSQTEAKAVTTPVKNTYLPTPLTHHESTATDIQKDVTVTPPEGRHTPASDEHPVYSSPPGDTQALSQFVYPPRAFADDVEDEAAEGVWGYLIPLDDKHSSALVLRKRTGCEPAEPGKKSDVIKTVLKNSLKTPSNSTPMTKGSPILPPGGYLIGRHPECGMLQFFAWCKIRYELTSKYRSGS